jgi:hypothetical protein
MQQPNKELSKGYHKEVKRVIKKLSELKLRTNKTK